jgi:uncharacterized membrane protein
MDDSIVERHDCAACRAIDLADGVLDGKLYRAGNLTTSNELRIVAALRHAQDQVADRVTSFAGSLMFVYLHAGWFGLWVLVNLGIVRGRRFDPYPFGLLTMVVSLEAIFLATFVMVSQNRQAARSDIRSEVDFENNVRSEIWAVHIGQALGIDGEHVERVVRQVIEGTRAELSADRRQAQAHAQAQAKA